jgi:hypothetical protein
VRSDNSRTEAAVYTYSTEVRWFFSGVLGEGQALLVWFCRPLHNYDRRPEELLVLESEDPANPRIDEYLVLPGTITAGPKLRGGDKQSSFEIKALAVPPASWRTHDGISGRVDSWTKWSFKHPTLTSLVDPLRQTGRWVRIAKDRWLRKINAEGANPAFVVADAKTYKADHNDPALRRLPDWGCNVELTQIFIDNDRRDPGKAWYSICLEAFGTDLMRTPATLDACAKLVFGELGRPPGIELTERHSLGYPAWIQNFSR